MAFLADYCLPAQVGEDGCDPDFATVREEQFDGVRAMVSERRVAVGLSALAAWDWTGTGNRIESVSMLNTLRTSIEAAIPYYLNTSIYSGGSLDGRDPYGSFTNWTKASLFTAQGIGNGANWTNAIGTYGSTLSANSERLAVHLNEIVLACQGLTHYRQRVRWDAGEDYGFQRYGTGRNTDCDSAKADSETSWAAASWTAYNDWPSARGSTFDNSPPYFETSLYASSNRVSFAFAMAADVSFFMATIAESGGSEYSPPVTADSLLHSFATASNVTTYTSDLIGDRVSMVFPVGTSCPIAPRLYIGWSSSTYVEAVAAPRFTLTT